jgi:hypothetical protein
MPKVVMWSIHAERNINTKPWATAKSLLEGNRRNVFFQQGRALIPAACRGTGLEANARSGAPARREDCSSAILSVEKEQDHEHIR